MPVFEVWSEGYAATGESGGALFLGTAKAATFEEACRIVGRRVPWAQNYDAKRNTHWGCRLFPTEQEARASFG